MMPAAQIFVVEDDEISRLLLQFALEKQGYTVTVAVDVPDAQEQLSLARIREVECMVTDYQMPGGTGLGLMIWLQAQDPSLATIIITVEDEKQIVAESLRSGAIDFLDKPVDMGRLFAAVARGVEHTRQQRRLKQSETAVKELGRAQERMLGVEAAHSLARVDVFFHPKHEAGGDFFSRFDPAPNQIFCLLTDVSGHDLQAAYISAYFQGVVRGMLERAAPLDEIFSTFNRLLLEEWNRTESFGAQPAGIVASVAACALLIDLAAQTATAVTHGAPAPVYWLPSGETRLVGKNNGFPLGWFPDIEAQRVVQPFAMGGSFCLWTDGLTDEAEKRGVSELSLAWALQRAKSLGETLPEIDAAADDILLVDIRVSPTDPVAESFRPLFYAQYHGGQSGEIDALQAAWRRSLMLALPELPEAKLFDVLLASRETVLNALNHGCGGDATQVASFQAAYSVSPRALRIRVCDPGPGHHFDLPRHEQHAAQQLAEAHRGLILVKHLATRVDRQREGATIILDFLW